MGEKSSIFKSIKKAFSPKRDSLPGFKRISKALKDPREESFSRQVIRSKRTRKLINEKVNDDLFYVKERKKPEPIRRFADDAIFQDAIVYSENKRENTLLRRIADRIMQKGRTIKRAIDRWKQVLHGKFMFSESNLELIDAVSKHPYIPDYMIASVQHGRSETEISSPDFTRKVKTNYVNLGIENPFKALQFFSREDIPVKKTIDSKTPTKDEIATGDVGWEPIPGDKSLGDVEFFDVVVGVETRESRIEELKKLKYRMENRPVPTMLYIPMTVKEADEAINNLILKKEIVATEMAVTHNLETHYILAVCHNADRFRPLVSKIVDEDKYPEQLFTDEFSDWIEELNGMWVCDLLPTNLIMYFMDLIADNFYYEGFMRKWNRVGAGGAAVEAIDISYKKCLVSTTTDEYFCDTIYRVNPVDYNVPMIIPTSNTFTENVADGPYLVMVKNPATNTACLKFQYNIYFNQPQTFHRVFITDETRPKSNAYIFITMCGESPNLGFPQAPSVPGPVPVGSGSHHLTEDDLLQQKIILDLKLPGLTGWMSLNKRFRRRRFKGQEGRGILLTYDRIGPGILEATFAQFNTAYSGRQAILRVTYPPDTKLAVSRISFINWRDVFGY